MSFFNSPLATYIGMVLAVAGIVLGVVNPDLAPIAWTIAGVLGVGSIAVLRSLIDSSGWKTYAILVVTLVVSGLQLLSVITAEVAQMLMVAFAPIIGITMTQALAKSSASVPKINGRG